MGSVAIPSPNARYIQWKAEMQAGPATEHPVLENVNIAYLPQNTPPTISVFR